MNKETVLIPKVSIKKETEKATLFEVNGNTLWLPKSQIINYNKITKGLQIYKWIADTKEELKGLY